MPTTTKGLRYPALTDTPHGPDQIGFLASDTDALLGYFVCTSGTRPGSPFQGQQIYETDTKATGFWAGAAWAMYDTVSQSYTPVLTASTTNPTMGASTLTGRYFRQGALTQFQLQLTWGAGFAAGSGSYFFTIPKTASSNVPGEAALGAGSAQQGSVRRPMVATLASTTTFVMTRDTSETIVDHVGMGVAWAVGHKISVSGTYEASTVS